MTVAAVQKASHMPEGWASTIPRGALPRTTVRPINCFSTAPTASTLRIDSPTSDSPTSIDFADHDVQRLHRPVTAYRPGWAEPTLRRKRMRRLLLVALLAVIALIAVTVIADRLAAAYAADRVATEIQKQGFNVKPNVKINGFPFLTQAITRDFHGVQLSAQGVQEGPLRISSLDATAQGVHLDPSYRKGTIDSLDGTGVVTFADLVSA